MNMAWIVGAFIAVGWFAVFERFALIHPDRQNTLSRALFQLGAKWPLSIFLMGLFSGGLSVHLFWHWCPS